MPPAAALLLAAAVAGDAARPAGPTAAEVAGTLAVAPGWRVELAAAEPLVVDPVAARVDAAGRAWVVEMRDYPSPPPGGFTAANPPRGRVRVLTDGDGDGAYDRAATFADGLAFPTGVQPWRGGAFVTLAGRVSYFPDDDGDGAADREDVWFTGFSEGNEQLRANRPTLAPDGWVQVANGLRGGTVTRGPQHPRAGQESGGGPLDISGRDFAFHPVTGAMRALAGAGQFGLSVTDCGDRWLCDNRHPARHAVLPDDLTALNPHFAVETAVHDVAAAGAESRLFPARPGFTTSLAHAGQFTAACGVLRWGDWAFTCEPTASLIHREVVRPAGATFASEPARPGAEFLTSTSPWFRPVNLSAAPGNSILVCDFARPVVEHPEWMPPELKDRPDLRDGATRGRLWRVVRADRPDPRTGDAKGSNGVKRVKPVQRRRGPRGGRRVGAGAVVRGPVAAGGGVAGAARSRRPRRDAALARSPADRRTPRGPGAGDVPAGGGGGS